MRKAITLLFLIFLAFFAFPVQADAPTLLRYSDLQPVMLKPDSAISEDTSAELIDQYGGASRTLMDNIHPILTSGYRIVDMDVSQTRIVLLLAREEDCFIRIAQWNEAKQIYRLTDSQSLPAVFLDTYHDGNAVLLEYYDDVDNTQEERLCITIQEIDAEWYLTDFTNASDYYACIVDGGYTFCDYYEYEDLAFCQTFECSTLLQEICWKDIKAMIDDYNKLFPLRPSLDDSYWD